MSYNFTSMCLNGNLISFILFRNWNEFSAWRLISFISCGNLVIISSNITSLPLSSLILKLLLLYFNPKIQSPPQHTHHILMSKEIGYIWQFLVSYKSYQLSGSMLSLVVISGGRCYSFNPSKLQSAKHLKTIWGRSVSPACFSKTFHRHPLIKLR